MVKRSVMLNDARRMVQDVVFGRHYESINAPPTVAASFVALTVKSWRLERVNG